MSDAERPTLWHFTCSHGRGGIIDAQGHLRPNRHPLMPELGPIIWLTDDQWPERDAVGLTSAYLSCDRMAFRFRVIESDAHPWAAWCHLVDQATRADLEHYAEPDRWWLATHARGVPA